MTITIDSLAPVVAIVAAIAILVMPKLLRFIIAAYLLAIGLLGLGVFSNL